MASFFYVLQQIQNAQNFGSFHFVEGKQELSFFADASEEIAITGQRDLTARRVIPLAPGNLVMEGGGKGPTTPPSDSAPVE